MVPHDPHRCGREGVVSQAWVQYAAGRSKWHFDGFDMRAEMRPVAM